MANKDIEKIIDMAQAHGEASEPDMEVGDLQEALRLVWHELTEYQQEVLFKRIEDEVFGGVTMICEVDFDEAEYIGDEKDGVYYAAAKGKDGWYASAVVDCNTSHFCEPVLRDDGPYVNEADALEAGRSAAIEWCITNQVNYEDEPSR